jgi:primosomal protein N''
MVMELIVSGVDENDLPEPKASQTLGEYLEEANQQFAEVNQVVSPQSVNGEAFSPEANDREIEQIDRLELSVQPIEETVVNTLMELAAYLDRALNNFPEIIEELHEEGPDDADVYRDQLDEAFDAIGSLLTSMIGVVNVEERLKPVKKINTQVKELDDRLDSAAGEDLIELFEDTRDTFERLRDEIETIVSVLAQQEEKLWEGGPELEEKLRRRIDMIPELVEELQSQPSPENYEEVDQMVDDLEEVLGFIQELDKAGKIKLLLTPEEQEKINEAHQDLDRGIDELNQAFEEKDVILICDILEYEILPYLEDIVEFIARINETLEE